MHRVFINEEEAFFLESFRVALSAETMEERLKAIRCVKHDVIGVRLSNLSDGWSSGWEKDPENRELVEWAAQTAGERSDAIYEFSQVARRYDDKTELRLNIAEQVGEMIWLSIIDGEFKGVQTKDGILYQVTQIARKNAVTGAKDHDKVRERWGQYRGVVHLGMAMNICEERAASPADALLMAEHFHFCLLRECPKGQTKPYVPLEEQISFVYGATTYGPRFRNRGLPFTVSD